MTLVRKLALKISDAVVRYASLGRKEWAEGLAREVAFVESDWGALGWALGSMRVLLDRREAPIANLSEIPDAARKLAKEIRRARLWILLSMFLMSLSRALGLRAATSQTQRVGCWLTIFVFASVGILQWARVPREEPDSADVGVNAIYYKLELERLLGYCSPAWTPLGCAILLLLGIGNVLEMTDGFRRQPVFSTFILLFWIAVFPMSRFAARKYQRRLHELDAVLTSGMEQD
jgi:hypothetical protein